ncbi:MAG TPA: peptidyl-prolyl cis-trans isomerase [Chthonomonadales bacterium]|nr:peptidyl-prolyl cis-trans isomerase [Chthonomonadales bacterium]
MTIDTATQAARAASGPTAKAASHRAERGRVVAAEKPRARRRFNRARTLVLSTFFVVGAMVGAFSARSYYRYGSVLVTVNGVGITDQQLYGRLEQAGGVQMAENIMEEDIRVQYARSKGLAPSDALIDSEFETASSDPNYETTILQRGATDDDIRRQVKLQLTYDALTSQGIKVSEAEVKAFYKANSSPNNPSGLYYTPPMVQLAVAIMATRKEANAASDELDSGTAFPLVAARHNRFAPPDSGGLLTPIYRGRVRVSDLPGLDSLSLKQFEDTVFNMQVGDTIGPTRFGRYWWIIRCHDRQPAVTQSFKSVKDDCRRQVMAAEGAKRNRQAVEQGLAAFRAKAQVQVFSPAYRGVSFN